MYLFHNSLQQTHADKQRERERLSVFCFTSGEWLERLNVVLKVAVLASLNLVHNND